MSRTVYDACRRYKHFYKKHEDVKGWDHKYHDIDLTQAVAKTKAQLNESMGELQQALFDEYDVECISIHSEHMGEFPIRRRYSMTKTDLEFINSREFIWQLAKHMQ